MKRHPGITVAGLAAIGAGLVHGGAIGIHAEHPQLSRLFLVVTVAQIGIGLALLLRPASWQLVVSMAVNAGAVAAWTVTRLTGIGWIDGLEVREAPQWTDSLCAGLGAVAAAVALGSLVVGERELPIPRLRFPTLAIAVVALPAMWAGTSHTHAGGDDHGHGETVFASGDAISPTQEVALSGETVPHAHEALVLDASGSVVWPRPYDPASGIDVGGVPGVTPEQESRAVAIIEAALRDLPHWADFNVAVAEGWQSIGDGATGYEHFIKRSLIPDGKTLDTTAPESLVYRVEGGRRTLVSAMFIAPNGTAIDDPSLTDFAGPLMQWHVHDNLCWSRNAQGVPVVVGVVNASGQCPAGSVNTGGDTPMVHVWIVPHQCGPFAALEGVGAGRAAVTDAERVDMCGSHGHPSTTEPTSSSPSSPPATVAPVITTVPATTVAPATYKDDGSPRISLAGFPGVSPEQQARAEDLIYRTRTVLPKFATVESARAAGFTSIFDSATGVEHYINWSYINDQYELDPNYPESLVYAVGPGGSRTLVSAMYMVGDDYTLETVPDIGGPLTQWHVHNNLCFSQDPYVAGSTRVVGVTSEDGPCNFGIKLHANPMIHVWLTPQVCGPFAALEGVGAGQIKPGEERLCDSVHSHG